MFFLVFFWFFLFFFCFLFCFFLVLFLLLLVCLLFFKGVVVFFLVHLLHGLVMCLLCLLICLVIYLFLQLLLLGGRSEYLFCFVFYCCCFLLFSPWGEGYFNMLVGRMKDSSSAGQSMTYISILEAYICFREEWEVLGVSMKSVFIILYYCIYPKYIFTNFF